MLGLELLAQTYNVMYSKQSLLVPIYTWTMLYQEFYGKEHTSQLLSIMAYPVCNITVMTMAIVSPPIQLEYDFPPTGKWVS